MTEVMTPREYDEKRTAVAMTHLNELGALMLETPIQERDAVEVEFWKKLGADVNTVETEFLAGREIK